MDTPRFNYQTRQEHLSRLQAGTKIFDAVIVGGGIVGAGLARELSIRGISSLLVEKGDFASGTSSRSSKLIHGGLRYLEMMDFHLVFEALAERHWLVNTHPHLVTPLEFDVPIYQKKFAGIGERNPLLLSTGLWLYDALSFFRTPFFHGKHSADEAKKLFPNLREEGLKGSFYYADAMMLDDEVVLETLGDALKRGALPLNYVQALDVSARGSDGLYTVQLQDSLLESAVPFSVKAKEVIACVGPWTEKFGSHVVGGAVKKLKPSKGVHLIVPWEKFPVEKCMVMYAPDGRIVFTIPRKDLGAGAEVVIIGTTDSPSSGEIEKVHATRADVDYLFKILKSYFPKTPLTPEDIIMTYAGVRPLLDSGAETEAKTSREHEIWKNSAGIVFMAGGKYTTFRKISQEIASFAFPHSKKSNSESKTFLSDPNDYKKRLLGMPIWGKYTDDWIRWKLNHHVPCTLEDVVFRRLPLWMAGKKMTTQILDRVIEIVRPYFGWSDADLVCEKAKVMASLELGSLWRLQ